MHGPQSTENFEPIRPTLVCALRVVGVWTKIASFSSIDPAGQGLQILGLDRRVLHERSSLWRNPNSALANRWKALC